MPASRPRKLQITLRRSLIGYPDKKRLAARSLGLRRIRHTVVRLDTPQTRGLIAAIGHLIEVNAL